MKAIGRIRNRLSLTSWSKPLASSDSLSNRQSRSFSAASGLKPRDASIATETSKNSQPKETPTPTSNLVELAAIITRETAKIDTYLKESGSPVPSFNVNAPLDFPALPEDIKKARLEVVRATKELGDLVTGPRESVRWMAWDHNNSLSLKVIYHYQIAKSFPIDGTATYAQIAEKVGLDEANVRRFMRHAMTNRIFKEVSPDAVAHSAASRVLAEDGAMNDWVGFCVDDLLPVSRTAFVKDIYFPGCVLLLLCVAASTRKIPGLAFGSFLFPLAATKTITALEENPSASEPTQTGFCAANGTTNVEPMFATFGKDLKRAKRMGGAMTSLTGGEGYEVSYLVDNYDWASINAKSGTVVDIGGSYGFVCVDLANKYKDMKFIVQDLPKTVNSAPKLEGDLGSRIQFQPYDFFTPQPVKGADVYLFRWIMHNYSDKYAQKLLKNLIPGLKKGSRILINDHCLRDGFGMEKTMWDEKIVRTMDLVMLTLLNAKERSEGEFRELFEGVDRGFRFVGVRRVDGCRMSIVEAVWEGEDFGGAKEVE
ncbi:O-methyltransferase-like protein [Halenospora varia]|nr:O-methyltransferase-like protein [Halenospora varia]